MPLMWSSLASLFLAEENAIRYVRVHGMRIACTSSAVRGKRAIGGDEYFVSTRAGRHGLDDHIVVDEHGPPLRRGNLPGGLLRTRQAAISLSSLRALKQISHDRKGRLA